MDKNKKNKIYWHSKYNKAETEAEKKLSRLELSYIHQQELAGKLNEEQKELIEQHFAIMREVYHRELEEEQQRINEQQEKELLEEAKQAAAEASKQAFKELLSGLNK